VTLKGVKTMKVNKALRVFYLKASGPGRIVIRQAGRKLFEMTCPDAQIFFATESEPDVDTQGFAFRKSQKREKKDAR
jgi:hypothetical protein